jgi:peptidoglycan hydrolase-like protein with peptidoglycan-binding domain
LQPLRDFGAIEQLGNPVAGANKTGFWAQAHQSAISQLQNATDQLGLGWFDSLSLNCLRHSMLHSTSPKLKFALCSVVQLAFAATLLLQFGGGTVLAQASSDELSFWSSVKDSKNPAELQAYLDRYPSGTFAGLARVRMQGLQNDGGSTTPRTVTPAPAAPPPTARAPAPSGGSALTSQAIIREAQTKLYNLNYSPSRLGRLDQATRTAIREWQTNNNLPVTGDLDAQHLSLLQNASVPTTWGALAFGPRGAFGTVWNVGSRKAAEDEALKTCRKGSAGDRCQVLAAANTACGAMAHSTGVLSGTRHNNAFSVIRSTLPNATDTAMAQCRQGARVPNACAIRTTFCANGSHPR